MRKTAKGAIFRGRNVPFEVREFPVTEPPKGYGASELLASGVCGTDLHIHSGRLGTEGNNGARIALPTLPTIQASS